MGAVSLTPSEALLERRQRAMGPAYRLFYEEPLHIVKGEGVWLFDAAGRKYLDCYNNVPAVGHCHPRVVDALCRQASILNTHTRYLHENIVRYAERLAATLPGDLRVCMFTCTGTEANDLAFRIARTVTGHTGAIVTKSAYHGNSLVVSELSTEKYPASQRPAYLATVEAPDPYRGARGGEGDSFAAGSAEGISRPVRELAARDIAPAMFLYDGIFSSEGVLPAPAGYLRDAYRKVRDAGGLVVADEVQSGLCRLGEHPWAFQDSGVVPDIVTMGKPLGNGHPLAVTVTTPAIASAFAEHFHYFNTFGGNPVSAAVGLAVLDVVEEEGILSRVHEVGAHLEAGFRALKGRHDRIGDVRGKGLFYGLDIVRDRESRAPWKSEAHRIREALRADGVLVGTTGPHDNVLKIRPPLVFTSRHADRLLDSLARALSA